MNKDNRSIFEIDWNQSFQTIIKITPEEARLVLDSHNDGNRYLRKAGSKYIANQILGGEWVSDHPQPICFSKDGRLLDGQHRMGGIALANEPVWASVRFGVNPDHIRYIDTGITRTLGDRIRFVSDPNQNKFIASMVSQQHQMTTKGKPSPEVAMNMFEEKRRSFEAVAAHRSTKRYVGTAVVGLTFVDYHLRYGDISLEMYRELQKNTTNCQPAQALRTFLATTIKRGSLQYPYIVSACLAHAEGRECKAIRAASWR